MQKEIKLNTNVMDWTHFFSSYVDITKKIETYLLEAKIEAVLYENLPENEVNYFTLNHSTFYSLTENNLDDIYKILTSEQNSMQIDQRNQLRKKNNGIMFLGLKEALKEALILLKTTLSKENLLERTKGLIILKELLNSSLLENDLLINIIVKTIGEAFLKNKLGNKTFEFECSFISVSNALGSNIFRCLTQNLKFNYYDILYLDSQEKKKDFNYLLSLKDKEKQTFELKSFEITLKVISHLQNLFSEKKLSQLFFDLEGQKLSDIVIFNIILNQIIFSIEESKQKFDFAAQFNLLMHELTKIRATFAGQMLNEFVYFKIFNIATPKVDCKFKRTSTLQINPKFEEELLLSMSYQKPFLYEHQQSKIDNISSLNLQKTHGGKHYFINLSPKMHKIMLSPKYKVKTDFLSDFIAHMSSMINSDYLTILLQEDQNVLYKDLVIFLELIYEIDFLVLKEKHKEDFYFLKNVLNICLNFNELYNSDSIITYKNLLKTQQDLFKQYLKELQFRGFFKRKENKNKKEKEIYKSKFFAICDDELKTMLKNTQENINNLNISLKFLNKITHKKFFISHLIQDLLLYTHFKFFHLGVFISYTVDVFC